MSRYFDWTTSLKRFVRFDTARAEDVNNALDELSAGLDGLDLDVDRSLKVPSGSSELLADAVVRANRVLSFDASGNPHVAIAEVDLTNAVSAAATAAAQAVEATTQAGISTTQAGVATTQAGIAATKAAEAAASVASIAGGPVTSVAGKTGVVTLAKGDVGLGNVDDTSDATKNAATATLTNKTLISPVVSQNVQVIGTNTTAVRSRTYVLTATLTLTLPASPTAGDAVSIVNRSGAATAVIARNGQNIMGLAEDMTLDSAHASLTLVFADATRGWVWA